MSRRGAMLLAGLAIISVALLARRERGSPAPRAGGRESARSRPEPPRVEPAVDPEAIRDVFRFVEPASVAPRPVERPPAPSVTDRSIEPFRLVGLVRRQGRLLAAFAVDGDVVLLGPGDTAGGVSVLEVDEEGVRVRHPDGAEARIVLP